MSTLSSREHEMRDLFRNLFRGWAYEKHEYSLPLPMSQTFDAILASAIPGVNFHVRVTVEWRGNEPGANAKVRAFTQDYLARVAVTRRATQAGHVADLINARGVTEIPVPHTNLVITRLYVDITVSSEGLAATAAWEEAERRAVLEDQRRRDELRQLQWLRDEIFGKPDLARMYWHLRHPADLRALADPVFDTVAAQLSGGEQATTAPRNAEDLVSVLISRFLADLGVDERQHLIGQLDRVFRSFDRADLANQLGEARDRVMS